MKFHFNKKMAASLLAAAMAVTAGGVSASSQSVIINGKISSTTCTLEQNEGNVIVNMGTASVGDLNRAQNVGDMVREHSFSINLTGCADQETVKVWATNTDTDARVANSFANIATADRTPAAVIKVFKQGTEEVLVPNGGVDTALEFEVGNVDTPSLNFLAQMVKASNADADLRAGNVMSQMTVNVSYN